MTVATKKEQRYIETIGRRKTASARVRITPSTKFDITINEKDLPVYFPTDELRAIVKDAFEAAETGSKYTVTVRVVGGGVHAQAEAVRHGIARALVLEDEELRKKVKKAGFLKRDPRAKERKKPGLKKARKASQWAKR